MELELEATPDCLRRVRHEVRAALTGQLEERVLDEVSLAIGEACANVVEHAYRGLEPGPLKIAVELRPSHMRVTIRDRGHPVDPERCKARPLDDVRPGGLGVHFIHCAFDPVEYCRDADGWNRLTLVRKLEGE